MTLFRCVKQPVIFGALALLVFSNSILAISWAVDSYMKYFAYFLIVCCACVSFLSAKNTAKNVLHTLIVFFVVSILFSFGLLLQQLTLGTMLRLIITMLTISCIAILGQDLLSDLSAIRTASYGILAGTLLTLILSLFSGIVLLEPVYDGIIPVGFNGGIEYKNFFGSILLAGFMGIYLYNRFCRENLTDKIVMWLLIIALLLSSARSSYIFIVAFLVLVNIDRIGKYLHKFKPFQKLTDLWLRCYHSHKIPLLIGVGLISAALILVTAVLLSKISSTYAMRYRGVTEYLAYVHNDPFHLLFGNAETVWANSDLDYVASLRGILGWNTSFEVAFINVLIKNGLVGLIGFVFLFTYLAKSIRSGSLQNKLMLWSVMGILLLSTFVESFAANIHTLFGVYCYMLIAGIGGMDRNKMLPANAATPVQHLKKWLRNRKE